MNFQEKFNEVIKRNAPKNLSLAQEISDLLSISLDAAYRRLRNSTEFSISEAMQICFHFDIPLEALNSELGSVATFKINRMEEDLLSFGMYLDNIDQNLKRMLSFENPKVIYAAEDIPVFYHYDKPLLFKFKLTYWMKSLLNATDFQYKSFEQIAIDKEIEKKAKQIYLRYSQLDTSEIWTTETISSTLKQIRFYWDAGFFDSSESVIEILAELTDSISEIQKSVEMSYKFINGSMTKTRYQFYLSDVMIGNNAILVESGEYQASFISYSTFNFMQTTNQHFNEQNQKWLKTLMSKSTLLSGVAEKQRNQFFKYMKREIHELKKYVEENKLQVF